jgi:hypothetical protein
MTPVPPTEAPVVVPCSGLWLGGGDVSGREVWWELGNDGGSPVKITAIFIDWPPMNQKLDEIKLGGDRIWDVHDDTPPTTIDSGWSGGNREVPSESSKDLLFKFHRNAEPSGYAVNVTLDNGCVVSGNH